MKRQNTSVIAQRRKKLQEIMGQIADENRPLTLKEITKRMDDAGYSNYSRVTLYRDRKEINKSNKWVRDVAEGNYSAYLEQCFETLQFISDQSLELAEKPWTKERQVVKRNTDGEVESKLIKEKEELESRYKFYRLAKEAEEAKIKMMEGDTLNISVAMLGKKLRDLKRERNLDQHSLNIAKDERDQFKEKLERIQKSATAT